MNLQRFIDAKQDELAQLRQCMPEPLNIQRPDFLKTLMCPPPAGEPLRVIAEFKKASPSAGSINEDAAVGDVAKQYAQGGASCMSVLTEELYFKGSLSDLQDASTADIPTLRKDFIFDDLQVRQSFASPCSALLLIVALTPCVDTLRRLRELAESQGIHAVVEIFSEDELKLARASGARIIQVNARNLETFETDREEGLKLASLREEHECWIAASAMSEPEHLVEAAQAGYQAALIGTALMRSAAPTAELQRLLRKDTSL